MAAAAAVAVAVAVILAVAVALAMAVAGSLDFEDVWFFMFRNTCHYVPVKSTMRIMLKRRPL